MKDLGFHHLLNILQRQDKERNLIFFEANDKIRPIRDID